MKYNLFLQLEIQKGKCISMGENHIISWDVRELIRATSGWYIFNQNPIGSSCELIPILIKGIFELTYSSKLYDIYDAIYGIGTIKDVLQFYISLLDDCKKYPYTKIYGSLFAE